LDSVICAVCVFLLVGWARDCHRQVRARKRWHLHRRMSLDVELELRRRVLDDLNRRG
jgi:hypothetical protein